MQKTSWVVLEEKRFPASALAGPLVWRSGPAACHAWGRGGGCLLCGKRLQAVDMDCVLPVSHLKFEEAGAALYYIVRTVVQRRQRRVVPVRWLGQSSLLQRALSASLRRRCKRSTMPFPSGW